VILCVAGNPSIDKLFEVERLALGAIHRPLRFVQLPGGKGVHIAQVATKLGAEAVVTGVLGGHAGRWFAETLKAEQVEGRFVWSSGETRSSLSVADRATGQMTEFYEAGAPVDHGAWDALEELVAELLPRASWVALAGSLPPGAPQDGYVRLMKAAHELSVPVALDTRGEPLAQAIAHGPDLIKINNAEAAELLGLRVDTPEEARAAASQLRARAGGDGHAAVVTMGKAGMAMATADGGSYRGSASAAGAYPVGSGDAFLAGMLVALGRGDGWPAAAALGLGAAAANAETPGAASLVPARAVELAERAQLELSG
jgi:1-phosphofructokinase family hexose kinase